MKKVLIISLTLCALLQVNNLQAYRYGPSFGGPTIEEVRQEHLQKEQNKLMREQTEIQREILKNQNENMIRNAGKIRWN